MCKMRKFRSIRMMVVRIVQNSDDSLYFPGVHWIQSGSLVMGADCMNFM